MHYIFCPLISRRQPVPSLAQRVWIVILDQMVTFQQKNPRLMAAFRYTESKWKSSLQPFPVYTEVRYNNSSRYNNKLFKKELSTKVPFKGTSIENSGVNN